MLSNIYQWVIIWYYMVGLMSFIFRLKDLDILTLYFLYFAGIFIFKPCVYHLFTSKNECWKQNDISILYTISSLHTYVLLQMYAYKTPTRNFHTRCLLILLQSHVDVKVHSFTISKILVAMTWVILKDILWVWTFYH